jgi:hypothetical protein
MAFEKPLTLSEHVSLTLRLVNALDRKVTLVVLLFAVLPSIMLFIPMLQWFGSEGDELMNPYAWKVLIALPVLVFGVIASYAAVTYSAFENIHGRRPKLLELITEGCFKRGMRDALWGAILVSIIAAEWLIQFGVSIVFPPAKPVLVAFFWLFDLYLTLRLTYLIPLSIENDRRPRIKECLELTRHNSRLLLERRVMSILFYSLVLGIVGLLSMVALYIYASYLARSAFSIDALTPEILMLTGATVAGVLVISLVVFLFIDPVYTLVQYFDLKVRHFGPLNFPLDLEKYQASSSPLAFRFWKP